MGGCLSDEQLAALAGGAGPHDQVAAWNDHLCRCDACAARFARHRALAARSSPPREPVGWRVPFARQHQALLVNMAVALALLVAVVGVWLWQRRQAEEFRRAARQDQAIAERLAATTLKWRTHAIAEHPDDPTVYADRGHFFLDHERWREAADDFSQVLARRSDDARAYWMRGDAYLNLGEYEPAIEDYARALELVEVDPSLKRGIFLLWNGWARALNGLGQSQRTEAALDAMLERREGTARPETLYGLGCVLAEGTAGTTRPDQALRLAHRLRDLGWKDDPTAHYWVQAMAQYRRRQFSEAFDAVMERIDTREGGPTALHWFLLAMIYQQLGEPEDARSYLRKGRQADHDDPAVELHERALRQMMQAEAAALLGRS